MLKMVDARMENNQIFLSEKIYFEDYEVKTIKVIFELNPVNRKEKDSLSKIKGLLKGIDINESEYYSHLENKYL
ncbi:putative Toxin-antitoxin system, antitoxin component, ribbon-helix-helix domain protein [Desulfamplus magnetovallimortis]|uniref:Putative Toxin-antitoxin system, antitoxin component, ribbon-helix-helix domain protein n=1 Tax=Desulfamplus magnetovallimortis TaxID=1246637 RepID=A0A1W1HDZ9_9BACT|nr:hypothetical protein [Desulfamplus magnetovallimortis]SLM30663.1 putative Toxin-antitoxin system, antitoxin component, ribbon-helix-helix domain protein [Desulfamplus magnetovallimortis]